MENFIIPSDLSLSSLVAAMEKCAQNTSQSVLDHGKSVWQHTEQLLLSLQTNKPLPEWWRIPQWLDSSILQELPTLDILKEYTFYHDCGKPFCRTIDSEGKVHFPNHAAYSEQTWLKVGGSPQAARLMGMDMDAHLLRADGIEEFALRPEAPTLLLVALAEVHSNAAMFGGTQSDSFKIKAKHLEKRGKQVLNFRASINHSPKA